MKGAVVNSVPMLMFGGLAGGVMSSCPSGWVAAEGRCFGVFKFSEVQTGLNAVIYGETDRGSWSDAQDFCAQMNTALATLHTPAQSDAVVRQLGGGGACWLGLRRLTTSEWFWIDARDSEMSNVHSDRRGKPGGERCGAASSNGMQDRSCANQRLKCFVCSDPAPSAPPSLNTLQWKSLQINPAPFQVQKVSQPPPSQPRHTQNEEANNDSDKQTDQTHSPSAAEAPRQEEGAIRHETTTQRGTEHPENDRNDASQNNATDYPDTVYPHEDIQHKNMQHESMQDEVIITSESIADAEPLHQSEIATSPPETKIAELSETNFGAPSGIGSKVGNPSSSLEIFEQQEELTQEEFPNKHLALAHFDAGFDSAKSGVTKEDERAELPDKQSGYAAAEEITLADVGTYSDDLIVIESGELHASDLARVSGMDHETAEEGEANRALEAEPVDPRAEMLSPHTPVSPSAPLALSSLEIAVTPRAAIASVRGDGARIAGLWDSIEDIVIKPVTDEIINPIRDEFIKPIEDYLGGGNNSTTSSTPAPSGQNWIEDELLDAIDNLVGRVETPKTTPTPPPLSTPPAPEEPATTAAATTTTTNPPEPATPAAAAVSAIEADIVVPPSPPAGLTLSAPLKLVVRQPTAMTEGFVVPHPGDRFGERVESDSVEDSVRDDSGGYNSVYFGGRDDLAAGEKLNEELKENSVEQPEDLLIEGGDGLSMERGDSMGRAESIKADLMGQKEHSFVEDLAASGEGVARVRTNASVPKMRATVEVWDADDAIVGQIDTEKLRAIVKDTIDTIADDILKNTTTTTTSAPPAALSVVRSVGVGVGALCALSLAGGAVWASYVRRFYADPVAQDIETSDDMVRTTTQT